MMRFAAMVLILAGAAVTACGGEPNAAPAEQAVTGPAVKVVETQGNPPVPMIDCSGMFQQGGLAICKTRPKSKVKIGRSADDFYYETANADGVLTDDELSAAQAAGMLQ